MKRLGAVLLLWHLAQAQTACAFGRTFFVVVPEDGCVNATNCGYGGGNAILPSAALGYSWIDGGNVRTMWNEVEVSDGTYNWTYLDAEVAAIVALRKKVALEIDAGWATPAWVYAAGAASFSSQWVLTSAHRGSPSWCQTVKIPVPWDATFLAKWNAMVAAFGARYASNPMVTIIKVTGINTQTDEILLPRSTGNTTTCASCSTGNVSPTKCIFPNDVANWANTGYTSTKMNTAFASILAAYKSAFPTQILDMMTGNSAFPPLGTSGQNDPPSANLPETSFMPYAATQLGPRFLGQENNWTAWRISPYLERFGLAHPIGLQQSDLVSAYDYSKHAYSDNPSCSNNRGQSPCPVISVFKDMLAIATSMHAAYFELFGADVTNPALQPMLQQAHVR